MNKSAIYSTTRLSPGSRLVHSPLVWAGWEWFRWLISIPPQPFVLSAMAVIVILLALHRLRILKVEFARLRQGRDGERAVGQYLDDLREQGWRVFHDIPGDGFNVDHVVMCPHGIFSVETKTISKPIRGDAKIQVDATRLLVNGRPLDRDPIVQAKAQARWLRELLHESTGRTYHVMPVVLFPGWYVEPMPKSLSREVWVLNPRALLKFLENEPIALQPEEIRLAAYHLSRYVRTTCENAL
jgi:hypothetical protein